MKYAAHAARFILKSLKGLNGVGTVPCAGSNNSDT